MGITSQRVSWSGGGRTHLHLDELQSVSVHLHPAVRREGPTALCTSYISARDWPNASAELERDDSSAASAACAVVAFVAGRASVGAGDMVGKGHEIEVRNSNEMRMTVQWIKSSRLKGYELVASFSIAR